jgi:hypothetical protein
MEAKLKERDGRTRVWSKIKNDQRSTIKSIKFPLNLTSKVGIITSLLPGIIPRVPSRIEKYHSKILTRSTKPGLPILSSPLLDRAG